MLMDQKKAREHILQRQQISNDWEQKTDESELSIDMVMPMVDRNQSSYVKPVKGLQIKTKR